MSSAGSRLMNQLDINIDQAVEAVPQGDELLAPISGESPDGLLQPAQVYEEFDLPKGWFLIDWSSHSIDLDAPIIPTKIKEIDYQGQPYYQWLAPNEPAVGWHEASALLGSPGNTVLNGHHNVYGEVFKDLVNVHEGDLIEVYSGKNVYRYRVALAMLLPERFKSLTVRLENARWILAHRRRTVDLNHMLAIPKQYAPRNNRRITGELVPKSYQNKRFYKCS